MFSIYSLSAFFQADEGCNNQAIDDDEKNKDEEDEDLKIKHNTDKDNETEGVNSKQGHNKLIALWDKKGEVKVDENQVFMYLLDYHSGSCLVEDIHEDIRSLFTQASKKSVQYIYI